MYVYIHIETIKEPTTRECAAASASNDAYATHTYIRSHTFTHTYSLQSIPQKTNRHILYNTSIESAKHHADIRKHAKHCALELACEIHVAYSFVCVCVQYAKFVCWILVCVRAHKYIYLYTYVCICVFGVLTSRRRRCSTTESAECRRGKARAMHTTIPSIHIHLRLTKPKLAMFGCIKNVRNAQSHRKTSLTHTYTFSLWHRPRACLLPTPPSPLALYTNSQIRTHKHFVRQISNKRRFYLLNKTTIKSVWSWATISFGDI